MAYKRLHRPSITNAIIIGRALSLARIQGISIPLVELRDGGKRYAQTILQEFNLLTVSTDVLVILKDSGAPTISDPEALEDLALECTLRALDLCIARTIKAQPAMRQAANAVATLKRILPEIIEDAGVRGDPAESAFRSLLLAAQQAPPFRWHATSEDVPSGVFAPAKLSWHTAARSLAGLYNLHVDPACRWSAQSAGVGFLIAALNRIGINVTAAAVEKALLPGRQKPDLWLQYPPHPAVERFIRRAAGRPVGA